MDVKVKIVLASAPEAQEFKQMHIAASSLADDPATVEVQQSVENERIVEAMFTIKSANQRAVVNSIGKAFRRNVENYLDIAIHFP